MKNHIKSTKNLKEELKSVKKLRKDAMKKATNLLKREEELIQKIQREESRNYIGEKVKKTITVSDHATKRYLERVLQWDIDDIIDENLKQKIYSSNGTGRFHIEYEDFTKFNFIVKDYIIVTILELD